MAADLQGAIHDHFFSDFSLDQLKAFTSRELESSGRLTQPLYAGPLESHYRKIDWPEAIDRISKKLRKTDPRESFFYFSGRSSNEAGFLMQLFARLWGTNNINNCSYYCHQASGVGLSSVTGSGTASIALEDIDHCDLLFLIGANPASNHPRLMRSIVDLKRRGGKVIVINPLKETGLVRFKVPSDVRSLLFGSTIADEYVQPNIGGDIALLSGITKYLIEKDALTNNPSVPSADSPAPIDHNFLTQHADGWPAFKSHIQNLSWDQIIHRSGVDRPTINRVAETYLRSNKTIFAWAMGVTHHEHGVRNVQAIANLAIMRGMLGGPGKGLLPLRGHSNVQGIGSMGVTPRLKDAVFKKLQTEFNLKLPDWDGMDTLSCMHRAHEGKIHFASCLGGNLFGSNPDANFAHAAMSRIDMVMYMSTTLNTGHAWGRGRETLILPVLARDEEPQPTTQESMFNYVRMSDGGTPRHQGPRSEIQIIANIAQAVLENKQTQSDNSPSLEGGGRGVGEKQTTSQSANPSTEDPIAGSLRDPGCPINWQTLTNHASIRQLIARIIPGYEQLADIDQTKKEFTIPGRLFHKPHFATDTGRAKIHTIDLPPLLGNNQSPSSVLSPQHSALRPPPSVLRLMTIRSEGQFNTVVYEEEDIYRGQERRDVILMNRYDIQSLGLHIDDRVTIRTDTGSMPNILVREFSIPPGNAAMYYPEANILIPKTADPQSKTPSFKSIAVTIEPTHTATPPHTNGHTNSNLSDQQIAAGSSRDRMNRC